MKIQSLLTTKNAIKILPYIVIFILAWIIFGKGCKSCNSTPDEKPNTIPTKEQVKAVKQFEKGKVITDDSFNLVLKAKDELIDKYYNNWQQTDIKLTQAERAVDDLLNESTIPDTCKEITKKIQDGFNLVKSSYIKKDAQAANIIDALKSKVNTQNSFLAKKDKEYSFMRKSFDTCIINAKKNEDYIKKIKPKREISLLVSTIFDYRDFKPDVGAGIGYRNKKGVELSAAIYTNQQVTLTLKKAIIRF